MSLPKKMTVNCSKCGKPMSVTVFESVNSDYADDIAMQIMTGKLFDVECPHCKFVSHLEYDILYHDMRHSAMVFVIHPKAPDYTKKLFEVRTTQKLPYKTLRIVNDMNALKEKVSCLESNRDDRIVELCKVSCAYDLLSQRPDFNFNVAFYTAVSGNEKIYLYDTTGNHLYCELSDDTYDYLKELYDSSRYASQFDNNYPIVDYNWAKNILIPLLETEGANSSLEEIDEKEEPVNATPLTDKKICPDCNTILPNDNEFCQGCDTKLSAPIPKPTVSSDATEELLSEFEIMEIKGSHPVVIQSAHLYCSSDREKYYLRCKFKSLSDKIISALMVDVYCFDVWGNELPTIQDAQILDLSPKRDETFGYTHKIPIADANTRIVSVKLKRIKFTDGTIEECSGEETKLPKSVPLSEYIDSSELIWQYNYETSKKSSLVPKQIGKFWMCACGKINTNAETDCANCGCTKQIVFNALDKNFLTERYSSCIGIKRKEEEALKRKKISKTIIIISIIVAAVLIAIGIIKATIDHEYNSQLRNFATEIMNDDYTNVYADIVSMNPTYFAYDKSGTITELICECKTVEGKTIWIAVDVYEYPGGSSTSEQRNEPQYYTKAAPRRIVGLVTTSGKAMVGLEDKIGNIFVLDVQEKIIKK